MDSGLHLIVFITDSTEYNYKIWGLWEADNLSQKVWNDVNTLLDQYGFRLDNVYNEPEVIEAIKNRYDRLFFWNGTIIQHFKIETGKKEEIDLVVFAPNLKIASCVAAHGAFVWYFGAFEDITTVSAFPHCWRVFLENFTQRHIFQ